MSTTLINLSPFEEQLMQAYGHTMEYYPDTEAFTDADLQSFGSELFGDGWGGRGVILKHSFGCHFPLINRFLGRLQSKGIVERVDCSSALDASLQYGEWRLTDSGRELLGVA